MNSKWQRGEHCLCSRILHLITEAVTEAPSAHTNDSARQPKSQQLKWAIANRSMAPSLTTSMTTCPNLLHQIRSNQKWTKGGTSLQIELRTSFIIALLWHSFEYFCTLNLPLKIYKLERCAQVNDATDFENSFTFRCRVIVQDLKKYIFLVSNTMLPPGGYEEMWRLWKSNMYPKSTSLPASLSFC